MSSKTPKKSPKAPTVSIEDVLQKYRQGSTKDFDTLLGALSDPNIEAETLISYLKQFKDCITILRKEFENVVGVILKMNWLERGEAVCVEYQSFVTNLVSAHPVYLRASLRMVVKQFMPIVDNKVELVDEKTRSLDEKSFFYLHGLLLRISQIVPMTPHVLVPLLDEYFPFMTKSAYLHEVYVKNLLQVTSYLPDQRTKILSIIVDRMAKLDARAPRASIAKEEEEDDDDSDTEEMTDVQFDMDDVDSQDEKPGDVTVVSAVNSADNDAPVNAMKHGEADRLDVMMDVLFRYTMNACHPEGCLDWAATKKLYLELLSVFDKIMLPSHALCHTQFLLFYICSFKEELTTGFIDFLWKKVSNPLTQVIFRQTAISYIASLLARAKYISLRLVQNTLDVLIEWVHKYVMEAAYTSSKADVTHHGTFYAVCQAVFYIIVFRHKQLLGTSKGHKYVQQLNLQTVVTSRLNPLKFCLPIIMKTFSSVMRQHQMVFCDTIMERNRRSVLSVEGTSALRTVNPLDSFFPFDPYLLSRSGRFVKPLYQEYEGTPAGAEDTRQHQEDEDLESQMEAESFSTTPADMFLISPSPGNDFLMYGTSPGFVHT